MKKVNSVEHKKMADGSRKTTTVGETKRGVKCKEVKVSRWNPAKKQRETHITETFGDNTKSKSKPKAKTKKSSSKKKTTNKTKKTKK